MIDKADKAGYNNNVILHKERKTRFMVVTKDSIIGDVLDFDRQTAPYFLEMGMHCLGCPSARGETIEQACMVHGVDPEELVAKLNAHFAK